MNKPNSIRCITKSPGKSLLSGGYLILDKSKNGLVININAYIECISFIDYIENESNNLYFKITSEYLNQNYEYISYIDKNKNELKILEKNKNENKWIQNCLYSSLYLYLSLYKNSEKILFQQKKKIIINIIIKSDYHFYSYNEKYDKKTIKTGLGSSSALITSLTSNLILFYDKLINKNEYKNSIKNLDNKQLQSIILISCLLSNNLSQNKIGSCFDIISCLLGSQIFSQSKKSIFLDNFYFNEYNNNIINEVVNYLKNEYINGIQFLKEDNQIFNTNICFISIEMGTDTRIFVKKVIEYAKNKKKNELFDDVLFFQLNLINKQIINFFINNESDYEKIKKLCKDYRTILRKISQESNVDIEPKILTNLLDNLINNENIIYSICPGAGGYDSIIVMGKNNINRNEFIIIVQKIIDEFNELNQKNKIDIKANILNVNLTKIPGTIIL